MTPEEKVRANMRHDCVDVCDWNVNSDCENRADNIILEALDMRIPKKPYNLKALADLIIGVCPSCGEGTNSEMPFCPMCGQAIDWEEHE